MSMRVLGLITLAMATSAFGSMQAEKVKVNPIRKIVGLLENMQKEIEVEGEKQKEIYDKFMCFCDNGAADLLKTANDAKAQNAAAISKLESDTAEKSQLESDIKQHETDLSTATADLEKATNIRDQQKAEFDEVMATKGASESALGKAIPAIEKGMGGAALLQVTGSRALKQIKRAIHASSQMTDDDRSEVISFLEGKAPGSGEILGMLKAMKDELSRDMKKLGQDEDAAVKGFADMKASKEKEIEFADESIESKKERVGTLAVEIVKGKDLVEDSMAEAEAAEKFAATLDKQCAAKKKEWAEQSKMRADELAAIGEAIGILTDDDALDVFKKSLPAASLVQEQPRMYPSQGHVNRFTGEVSFLQQRRAPAARLQKAQAMIALASKEKTPALGMLLFSLKSKMRLAEKGAVDFSAIFKMIDEMIAILTKEQKDDATQRDFCVGELDKTEREKTSVDDKMASLASQIEEVTDSIAGVADNIKELTDGVATLDKDVAEATELRKTEHSEFTETVQLSEVAEQLIGKAKNRLLKFYNPTLYKAPPKKEMSMEEKIIAGGSSALVQQEAAFDEDDMSFAQVRSFRSLSRSKVAPPEAPESATYEKNTEKSGGVMALMDMIMGELKASLLEAKMTEKYAQKEYVELMKDSQEKRATDLKSITESEGSKAELEGTLQEAKENQMLTMDQQSNVIKTLAKLHGSCDFILKNFEVRLNARTAEIEGLKQAKAVLAGANFS